MKYISVISIYKLLLIILIVFMLNITLYNILFRKTIEGFKFKKPSLPKPKIMDNAVKVVSQAQAQAAAEGAAKAKAQAEAAAKAAAEGAAKAKAQAEAAAKAAAEIVEINNAIGKLFNTIVSMGSSFNNIIKSLNLFN